MDEPTSLEQALARIRQLEAETEMLGDAMDNDHEDIREYIKEVEELRQKLREAQRWETGFRAIVTRIHGSRKEFDIQMIVEKVNAIHEGYIRPMSEICALQLEAGTREWKLNLYIDWLTEREAKIQNENNWMRLALAPILGHASAPNTSPPLRLSVSDCKKIKGTVEEANAE